MGGSRRVRWRRLQSENFPEAIKYCYSHIAIVQILRAPNDEQMAAKVAQAIIKVFNNLDELK